MKILVILFMFLVQPTLSCADCVLTESPYQIVCSGGNEHMKPSLMSKGNTRSSKRSGKPYFSSKNSSGVSLHMTEEEITFMKLRNMQEGERAARKSKKVQVAKK